MRGASSSFSARLAPFLAACLPFLVQAADAAKLPKRAPIPEILRSAPVGDLPGRPPSDGIPLPEPAPRPAISEEQADTGTSSPDAASSEPPRPEFRPDKPQPDTAKPEEEPVTGEAPPPVDPRSAVRPDPSGALPEEELACRKRLTELGVKFKPRKAQSDPAGCSMPYPLVVTSLGGFSLEPEAEMNCAMTEAAARFARDVISPAAKQVFGETLKSISHASAYVCRPRAGTMKLSEHAFGNALDISAFKLSAGITVAVEPAPPEKNGAFLTRVRGAACGPFKTVLGPGAPDHSEHLHFDLAPRRNGGTVCE